MACFNIFDIFDIILHRACSMQHGVFDLSLTSSTCFNIHSNLMAWLKKLEVSAFQNFLWIENWLNIKERMSKNIFVCIFEPLINYS